MNETPHFPLPGGSWAGFPTPVIVVPEDHVFGLVSYGDNPDLEFTLLADDLLGLAHGDPCKLDTDIPGDPVKARQGINPGITGTEAVDLAFEDPFHIIGGLLRDPLLV